MEAVLKVIKDIFTEDDNESADLIPIMALLGVLVYLGLYVYVTVAKGQPFNATDFGIGFGTMQTAFGFSFKLKRDAQVKPMADDKPAAVEVSRG